MRKVAQRFSPSTQVLVAALCPRGYAAIDGFRNGLPALPVHDDDKENEDAATHHADPKGQRPAVRTKTQYQPMFPGRDRRPDQCKIRAMKP